MLWPHRTNDAAEWPEGWPGLDSPYTAPRERDQYSLYVDIEALETFQALAAEASAVQLGGNTWAFSMRLPFPHEVVWPTGVDPPAALATPEATAAEQP